MVAAADTAVRKPIAMQNNSSVRHQPVISDVAMTAVAQPLMMLTVAVADAAAGEGRGRRAGDDVGGVRRGGCSSVCGDRGVVGGSGAAGNAPVGWRRMMPVCCSRRDARRSVGWGGVGLPPDDAGSSDGGPPEVTGQPT